nr:receptor binding protein [Paramyxoviridae sp.]
MDNKQYFGKNDKEIQEQIKYNKASQRLSVTSAIIGILSLIILIILNITTLIGSWRGDSASLNLETKLEKNHELAKSIDFKLTADIKPQIGIINKATGITIPSMLNNQFNTLRSEFLKVCIPRYEIQAPGSNKPQECPVKIGFMHDSPFSLYDPEIITNCSNAQTQLSSLNALTLMTYASFIPSATNPKGCVRIPTFSLSGTVYSYSHNIMPDGCHDADSSSQYWSIGRIVTGYKKKPAFEEVINWYMDDDINRKSCSTAAGSLSAWLVCSVVTMDERTDYKTPGIMNITVDYMDVFGKKSSWFYQESQITFDRTYVALYPAVGSGVVISDKVYIPIYGALENEWDVNAFCILDNCPNATQQLCNDVQKQGWYNKKQSVIGILTFQDDPTKRPQLSVRTISPQYYPIGAEWRLYHEEYSNKNYIYLRSNSWYTYLLFGEINLTGNLSITWYNFRTMSRPGRDPCSNNHVCPTWCFGGVYTDFYLLNQESKIGVSVILTGGYLRRGPQITLADERDIYMKKLLTDAMQTAGYTTTTCFLYYKTPYCISIVEMSPGTVGSFQPTGFLYPVWATCDVSQYFLKGDLTE